MGLLSAISNAVSGLNVNQKNLDILSQNISNANTPNYSKQVANQQAMSIDGNGTGVSIASVTRIVSDYLNSQVQTQTSNNNSANMLQTYYGYVQNLLGQPGGTSTIDKSLSSFFSAVQDLANSPSVSAQTNALNAGTALASQLSSLSSSLYGLQAQADTDINNAVKGVNSALQTLHTVNNALQRAAATNQNNASLLDQRDAALNTLAQYVDIKSTFQTDGEVSVNTISGITLLNSSINTQLTYTPAAGSQSFIDNNNMDAIQVVSIDTNGKPFGQPVPLTTSGPASGIATSLKGGQLQGLLTARDTVIPNILGQLDNLAANLSNQVNAITNSGTSSPPPNSYTSTRLLSGTSLSQYSGNVQIAVLNSAGSSIPSPYGDEPNGMAPLSLDLSKLDVGQGAGMVTVDGLINSINQYNGAPQHKLELGNINNVQLAIGSPNVPDSNNTLNLNFNLNNISNKSANLYVSGMTVLDSSGNVVDNALHSTQPSLALSGYQATANNTITVSTTGANTLKDGDIVYIAAPTSAVSVGGVSSNSFSGQYYKVSNITGGSFDITVAGVTAGGASVSATGATALPPYASVDSGQSVNTGANGSFTANLGSSTSAYFTVQANIASVDSAGNVVTSTVSYRVANNVSNSKNNVIGASSANGDGTVVIPKSTAPLATATLVDASGNPLPKINGVYGNQVGYLKITANNASQTIAINELDSQQLGLPNGTPAAAGTNQGFSQYFGFNNFFNNNQLTATGDTMRNSALNLSVNSNIINNPSLISTGTLSRANQPADSSLAPNFTYQVTSGDNSVSQKLAGLATKLIGFSSTGGLAASTTTFSQFAGQVIATASANSASATSTMNDSQTLLTGFTTRAQAVSGVNLDQELANTVIYQNAYTASTRVITIVSQMFTQLMGIVQ